MEVFKVLKTIYSVDCQNLLPMRKCSELEGIDLGEWDKV